MTITLDEYVTKKIIKKLINGEDYRIEIVSLLDASFLQESINFFKKVVDAKLKNTEIGIDWYKKELLNNNLPSTELIINAGLNRKTILDMYNSASRGIVLNACPEHYDTLINTIESMIDGEDDFNLTITLKINSVSVELNLSESLIVINSLSVKRAAMRGGLWSTVGKRVEKPLMITLCKLYGVSPEYYAIQYKNEKNEKNYEREIDFYLHKDEEYYKCEVKLMGKGNPESADAFIARDSTLFIADKLSLTNIEQFMDRGCEWVQLRTNDGLQEENLSELTIKTSNGSVLIGFQRFETVLDNLGIPHSQLLEGYEDKLDEIIEEVFNECHS